jgi:hypothetical protein
VLGRRAECERAADDGPRHALDAHPVDCQQHAACGLIDDGQGEAAFEPLQEGATVFAVGCVQRDGRVAVGGQVGPEGLALHGDADRAGTMHGRCGSPARGQLDRLAGAARSGQAALQMQALGLGIGGLRPAPCETQNSHRGTCFLYPQTATLAVSSAPDFEPHRTFEPSPSVSFRAVRVGTGIG